MKTVQKDAWERVQRVSVYNSTRQTRYPSIARTANGTLLVLFTRQTEEQKLAGRGDLLIARSKDNGETWGEPIVVLESQAGELRAIGTLTALRSGRLIAPFTELSKGQVTSEVRLLSSDDAGVSWEVIEIESDAPLAWWAPRGRVIETADGTLMMPVYGAASEADLKATIHNCGLLRSGDGGRTFGDFSWIAKGPGPVFGAEPGRMFSFEGPAVEPLPDGTWLAMVTARRLNREGTGPTVSGEGPGTPEIVCRQWSSDEGRTWTPPDQLVPGSWPALIAMGDHTVCALTSWDSYGVMFVAASRDGFKSLFQTSGLMSRGWLQDRLNNPHETPQPPTVPYLADEWAFEHYGFPSCFALDAENFVVVFNRPQRGNTQVEGMDTLNIPWEHERIQAVFFRRTELEGQIAPPLASPARPRGRWILSERINVPDIGHHMAQAPDGTIIAIINNQLKGSRDGGRSWQKLGGPEDGVNGVEVGQTDDHPRLLPGEGALGVLSSGRWLVAEIKVNQEWQNGQSTEMGLVGGYLTFKLKGESYDTHIVIWRSDDEGATWAASEPFKGPFKWAHPTVSHFIESRDGTIALPIFGCVTEEEMSSYSSSNGVIRSTDGGQTWGDFSFVFRTQPPKPDDHQPEPRYSEMDIVELANGHWVAYSRNERITMGPAGWGATAVALSEDLGQTWRRTGGSLAMVSQQKGVVLPDGGIALTYRCHSWQQPGIAITYDEGRSFDYLLTGPYETVNAFMHGEDEFVVFSATSHRSDSLAAVYRWVPGGG